MGKSEFKVDKISLEELPNNDVSQKGHRSYRMVYKKNKKEGSVYNTLKIFVHEDKSLLVVDEDTGQSIYLYKEQIKHLREIIKEID